MSEFIRDWVPDWLAYADREGISLRGAGKWRTAPCSIHGGSDSLRVNIESQGWRCMNCDAKGGDVLAHLMQARGLDFISAARELGAVDEDAQFGSRDGCHPAATRARPATAPPVPSDDELQDQARKLASARHWWSLSLRIERECPAGEYLFGRDAMLPPADSDLRWIPNLRLFGFAGPALVGRMSLATNHRQGRGLHCTWFERNGTGWRRAQRRYLGPKAGAVVRLWPDESVTLGLAVGEGVETCLSLAHAFTPVWACMDAGNLAALPVLGGIESLLIAADNDEAGIDASEACAQRWVSAGCEVSIVTPGGAANDINDLAQEVVA